MNWQTIIDPDVCGRVCLTLLHSLWQVALLAVAARILEWSWARRSTDKCYAVYVTALVAAFAVMSVTYLLIDEWKPLQADAASEVVGSAATITQASQTQQPVQASAKPQLAGTVEDIDASTAVNADSHAHSAKARTVHWSQIAPWFAGLYVVGVAAMLLRLAAGIVGAHRLAARAIVIEQGPLVDTLRKLARNWSMRVVPVLARAESIVVPKVVGFVKPTILLPASAITGLSSEELEMVLAHELAHVKRYDMWVNLAQRLAEAVLFFNPALWYISRRISSVREYCCDELTCGSIAQSHRNARAQYALALLRVVELSRRLPDTTSLAALAASGRSPSELRRRVARLFGEPMREPLRISRGGVFAILALAAFALLGPLTWKSDVKSAEENPKKNEPVEIRIVVAKHVILLEGKQIITWKDLEGIIAAMPQPELAHPTFYETGGARDAGMTPVMKDNIWKIHKRFNLKGHSEASMWPRADWRYDQIKEAADLQPDESLAVAGTVLNQKEKSVTNAQLVLVTPVDDSISYKEIDIALVQGRLRNTLEEVNTTSDKDGKFKLYPAKGKSYYILALHPNEGFAMVRSDQFVKQSDLKLLPWAALIGEVGEEPGEKQDATLRTALAAEENWPKLTLTQYWDDLKDKRPTRVFGFTHVPPIIETSISRNFAQADGGSIGLPGAEVSLLPGETRSLDLGPLSDKQREWLEELRSMSREREKGARIKSSQRPFELTVVGPDGKPVPNAEVEIRIAPAPQPEHVLRGEFVKAGRSASANLKADHEGRLVFTIPPKPKSFTVHIEQAGYAPYWAQWDTHNHPEEIPAAHVAKLDAGWAVDGVVVDGEGKPVEGVTIGVSSIRFKMRPGDLQELHVGTELKTAADGTWSYGCVPASMDSAIFTFNHPKFMTERATLSRGQYEAAGNGKLSTKVELKRGLTITGTVTDESGQPISGALVRNKFVNESRESRTGDDGKYELVGCEPSLARIVVSAPGKALDLKEVRIEPDPEPLDFVLKPGGHLRVIALDENGKPIPKTRIFFQQWRGRIEYFEFDHVNGYADENGVWEWNDAPHDAIVADICRPEGMQLVDQVLKARDEEYIFKPPQALVVSGTVTDAATKQPIKKFRVIPGLRFSNSPNAHWSRENSYEAADGKYSIKQNREYLAHLVRIEADGYRAAASRDIKSDEGSITIDFALERGENITTSVLTPEGDPAVGAKVAIGVAGSHISIENGDFRQGSSRAAYVEADGSGRVKFPPQEGNFHIVVTHPTGYAHVKASPETVPESIRLIQWGRIEGVYRVGENPAPNTTLEFNSNAINAHGQNEPSIYASYRATTGADGEFDFERVFAGRGWLGPQIVFMMDEGATEVASSKSVPLEIVAGQTKQVNVGGDGTAVVGKLTAAEGVKDEVPWHFARLHVRIEVPPTPRVPVPAAVQNDRKLAEAWFKEWQLSPEGIAWKGISEANQRLSESNPSFTATLDRDGSFRIDDVPPGSYSLSMYFDRQKPAPGRLADYKFAVPAGADAASESIDLGVLQLER